MMMDAFSFFYDE